MIAKSNVQIVFRDIQLQIVIYPQSVISNFYLFYFIIRNKCLFVFEPKQKYLQSNYSFDHIYFYGIMTFKVKRKGFLGTKHVLICLRFESCFTF
jgi:hypothetical protein